MSSVNSVSAAEIKRIQKLHQKKYRDETGLYIAEGMKFLEEIISSGQEIEDVYVLEGVKTSDIKFPVKVIGESVMKKISTTDSACEVLTVAKKRTVDAEKFKTYKSIALFEAISDPGNLGTIIRSAAAFGIEGIVLYGNCVDLYSSKVIRSCAGNFFKIPVIQLKTLKELQKISEGRLKISASLGKKNNLSVNECVIKEKYLVMFGSEASGLSSDLIDFADKNLRIGMKNNVESLNLAVSASIIFYELSAGTLS